MIPRLEDIDSIYRHTIKNLPASERILYCENLIDKIQLSLLRNKGLLNKTSSDQLICIMGTAQQEIINIRKK